MTILPSFRFRSITHRLIFACVLAAIVLYSVSFWHMRQVVQEGTMSWMIQLAQSRIDAVAAEVEGILRSVEQNANMVVRAEQQTKYALNESSVPLLQTLMAQQSFVRAVAAARLPTSSSATTPSGLFGLRTGRQGTYQALGDRDITSLLARCQDTSTATQRLGRGRGRSPQTPLKKGGFGRGASEEPFWTQPYRRNPPSESLGTIYCVPLSQTLDREQVTQGILAIELNLCG